MAATVATVCCVLPAEFRVDITGFGRLTGLTNLADRKLTKPNQATRIAVKGAVEAPIVTYSEMPYRADVIDIPLNGDEGGPGANELEYKVRMKAASTLVYAWMVDGVTEPEAFYFDFHGESLGKAGSGAPQVIEFQQATGLLSAGMLTAPTDGIFGWYFQNQSANAVVVHLKISGFYELIAPGEYGNTAGILPKR